MTLEIWFVLSIPPLVYNNKLELVKNHWKGAKNIKKQILSRENVLIGGNKYHCPNADTNALFNVPFVSIFMTKDVVSSRSSRIILLMIVFVLDNIT
jgi:hypothetical protein